MLTKNDSNKKLEELIAELKQLVDDLRDPVQGDPWIIAQNFQSMAPWTIEEAYEFAESAAENDFTAMCDELGDLMLHLFLYAHFAKTLEKFDLTDIIQATLSKQKRRRIEFGISNDMSAEEVLKKWDQKKQAEKTNNKSALAGIAKTLPSIIRAFKLQKNAATAGFDWRNPEPIYDKIAEEIQEFQQAVESKDSTHMEEELGDLLFTVINLARHYGINPDAALHRANRKFTHRFEKMEQVLAKRDETVQDCSLTELDVIWESVKRG